MNMTLRRILRSTPVSRRIYNSARRAYGFRRIQRASKRYFINADQYLKALRAGGKGTIDICTKDGLVLTIRQDSSDADILAEIFLGRSYTKNFHLPDDPVVVDIGGYIGDFALFAVKYLNARQVIVCEPSPENWALLRKNVAANPYGERISAVNKAVTDGRDIFMNVDARGRAQATVSAYHLGSGEGQLVPGISLSGLVEAYRLDSIDLLKIDCEGGEYVILLTTPSEVFSRTRNIVVELHEIDGFQDKLRDMKQRLLHEGFSYKTRGSLLWASRQGVAAKFSHPD